MERRNKTNEIPGDEIEYGKTETIKKDRLAGKKLYQTEKKKPFYAQMQPRQKQKPKKNHPFGDGWEIADDYEEE